MLKEDRRPLAFRLSDFCRLLGISRTTLYTLLKRKKIRSIYVGRRRLIPAQEADRLISGGVLDGAKPDGAG